MAGGPIALLVVAAAMIGAAVHSCEPRGPQIACRELGRTYSRKDLRDLALSTINGDAGPLPEARPAAICLARAGDHRYEFAGAGVAYQRWQRGGPGTSGYLAESCGILRRCAARDEWCAQELRVEAECATGKAVPPLPSGPARD